MITIQINGKDMLSQKEIQPFEFKVRLILPKIFVFGLSDKNKTKWLLSRQEIKIHFLYDRVKEIFQHFKFDGQYIIITFK